MSRISYIDPFDNGDTDDIEISFDDGSIMVIGNDAPSINNLLKELDEIREELINQLRGNCNA